MLGFMESKGERELLAIVFTDAVGSSSQTALDEDKSLSMLMADLDSIRNEAAARGGSVLKNTGDGLLISFKSAVDAIECALSIQKAFQGRPKGQGFQHKIGVHIGDVIKKDGDIYGAGVNTASRLVDQCAPGGICLSSTLFELTKQKSEIGRLKLQNFMLQNTEPPTLAYKSLGVGGAASSSSFKPTKKQKTLVVLVGMLVLGSVLAGIVCLPPVQARIVEFLSDSKKYYGFEFSPKSFLAPKSLPSSKPIEFTLENQTSRNFELKWIDPAGRLKTSDFRERELLSLGPKGIFGPGTTYEGHVFELKDVIEQKKLGYLLFDRGQKLNLVIREKNGLVTVQAKGISEAQQGDAFAQAKVAKSYYLGQGLPQNYERALFWAKKSSKQNCVDGLTLLAQMYEEGRGVPKDTTLGSVLRKRAEEIAKK